MFWPIVKTGPSDAALALNYIWGVDVQRVCLGLGLKIPRGFPGEDQGSDIMTGVISSNFETGSSLGPLHTHPTGTLRNCENPEICCSSTTSHACQCDKKGLMHSDKGLFLSI